MEESLAALLLADTGVAALAGKQIAWGKAGQTVTPPYAVLNVITGLRDTTHDGPSGLKMGRVQIDCYGTTPLQARTLARAVEAKLNGFKGTQGGTIFDGIFFDSERDGYEDSATPDKRHRVSTDYLIWHKGA